MKNNSKWLEELDPDDPLTQSEDGDGRVPLQNKDTLSCLSIIKRNIDDGDAGFQKSFLKKLT